MTSLLLLWTATAHSATLTVAPGTSGAYQTFTEAIEAAESGDTIVTTGSDTFAECLDISGKTLTISGPTSTTSTLPVIDGTGLCTNAVAIQGGATVTWENIDVHNDGGRGFYVGASTLDLTGTTVSGTGASTSSGGALYAEQSVLSTTDCTFDTNTADAGGALYLYNTATWTDTGSVFSSNTSSGSGGAVYASSSSSVTLSGTQFTGNEAGSNGGAIVATWYSGLDLSSTTFAGNTAAYSGGAIYTYVVTGDFIVSDSVFDGNEARDGWGGAIEVEWYSLLQVLDSHFEGNSATAAGGAISQWYETSAYAEGSTFVDNTAGASGGGWYWNPYQGRADDLTVLDSAFSGNASGSWGGGLYASWSDEIQVADTSFDRNTASGNGGGFAVYVTTALDFSGNRFCGNTAYLGGGAQVEWADSDLITNTVFVDNTAERGGGLFRYASDHGASQHNTFVGNSATWGGAFLDEWGATTLDSSAFFHNVGGAIYTEFAASAGSTPVRYDAWGENTPIDGTGYFWVDYGTDGNVNGEPLFASYTPGGDCAAQDLRPLPGSVLIDAADPSTVDRNGSRADIGAYGGPDARIEDHDADGVTTEEDCLDGDPTVFPGAEEVCDGVDNDCDGTIDGPAAVDAATWYSDLDGDGFGDSGTGSVGCGATGMVTTAGDCDDTRADVHPEAEDAWYDGIDADCDGANDFDADGDGHDKPVGDNGGRDCDDADPTIYPSADDTPGDGIDQDCDGADDTAPPEPEEEEDDDAPVEAEATDGEGKSGGCSTAAARAGGFAALVLALPLLMGRRRGGLHPSRP